jgi:thiamine kinase
MIESDDAGIDIQGAVALGRGKSGHVLRLRDGTVLKLFAAGITHDIVERESRALTEIRRLGIRSADPIEILSIDERWAIRASFVPGRQLLHQVKRSPIGMTAALVRLAWHQARLHAVRVDEGVLPSGKTMMADRIATSLAGDEAIRTAQARLAMLPDGDRLCHGDLHLGNVIADAGRWTIVDWARATTGTPACDAARTRLLIRFGASHFADQLLAIRFLRWLSAQLFTASYCAFTRTAPAKVREWDLPLAVAWMQGQDSYRAEPLARLIAREMSR